MVTTYILHQDKNNILISHNSITLLGFIAYRFRNHDAVVVKCQNLTTLSMSRSASVIEASASLFHVVFSITVSHVLHDELKISKVNFK